MKYQINSKHCFVCGTENQNGLQMTFQQIDASTVQSKYIIAECFQGWSGIAHGGIVASILDEVMARLFIFSETEKRFLVTAKLEIKYRRPVPIGKEITIMGKKLEDKGKLAKAQAVITNGQNEILAEAVSIFIQANDQLSNQLRSTQENW